MILRERIRDEIREELAKHKPVETARMALELLAEISIRFVEEDGSAGYQVLDQNGRPRTKVVDGKAVDLAIPDLVADLRDKHPTLFQPANDTGPPKASPTSDVGQPAEAEAARPSAAGAGKTAATTPRDGLMLGPSGPEASPAAEARNGGTVAKAAELDRDAPTEPTPASGEPTPGVLAAEPRHRNGAPADQASMGIGRAASGA